MLFDILFIFIIFIILIIIYVFRFTIFSHFFKFSPYNIENHTECISESGKCNEKGMNNTYHICDNENGCIWNNKLSFTTYVEKISCIPMCKSSIFTTNSLSSCVLASYVTLDNQQLCITSQDKITGVRTRVQECIAWDAYGVNTCTYNINNSSIGDNCVMQNDGVTVICNTGSIYQSIEPCNNPVYINEKGEEVLYKKCGQWLLSNNQICQSNNIIESSTCRNFIDGNYMSKDTDILHVGWVNQKLYCKGDEDTNVKCSNLNNIDGSLSSIVNSLKNGKNSISQEGDNYSCNTLCLYVKDIEGNWNVNIKNRIAKPLSLIKSRNFIEYILSINNDNNNLILTEYGVNNMNFTNATLYLRPTREEELPNYLYCNILLTTDTIRGYLYYNQTNLYMEIANLENIGNNTLTEGSEFLIYESNINIFNIRNNKNETLYLNNVDSLNDIKLLLN